MVVVVMPIPFNLTGKTELGTGQCEEFRQDEVSSSEGRSPPGGGNAHVKPLITAGLLRD